MIAGASAAVAVVTSASAKAALPSWSAIML
jgi:hypothetical protein